MFFHAPPDHPDLHSFPTRRSSDLFFWPRPRGIALDWADRHERAMKTVFAKAGSVRGDWFVVDASDKTLGRLASQIAHRLKDRKSTRLNSSHVSISYAVFCLKKKKI